MSITFRALGGTVRSPDTAEEDPAGDLAHEGWPVPPATDGQGATVNDWFDCADAFLLGRMTYALLTRHRHGRLAYGRIAPDSGRYRQNGWPAGSSQTRTSS